MNGQDLCPGTSCWDIKPTSEILRSLGHDSKQRALLRVRVPLLVCDSSFTSHAGEAGGTNTLH